MDKEDWKELMRIKTNLNVVNSTKRIKEDHYLSILIPDAEKAIGKILNKYDPA